MRKASRFGALKLGCLATVVLLIGTVVLMPPVTPPISQARERSCENNLRQLGVLLNVYAEKHGGPDRSFPSETGKKFWVALTQTKPPLLEGEDLEALFCPAADPMPERGSVTYWGPAKDSNLARAEEYIACCRSPSHPHGPLALRKDGKVVKLSGKELERLQKETRE